MKRSWHNSWKPSPAWRIMLTGLALIVLAVTILVQGWKRSTRSDWRRAQAELGALGDTASRIGQAKSERIACLKKIQFLNFPGQYSFSLADFVRRLSLVAIPGMAYSELRIEPGTPVYRFVLRGRLLPVGGSGLAEIRSRLQALVDQIKEFPGVSEAIVQNDRPAGAEIFDFTISGRVEPE